MRSIRRLQFPAPALAPLFTAFLLFSGLFASPAQAEKPAPITISGVVGATTAHLSIRFGREAEDIRVTLRGDNGLSVTSDAAPIKGASAARGEKIAIDVSFERGPDRSSLMVEVTGKFDGVEQSATQSFRVGIPNDEQRHDDRTKMTAPLKGRSTPPPPETTQSR